MATLPYSRDITVNLYRNRFPQIRGFGVAMLLTTQEIAGKLDADNLTRTYGSIAEVAADFASTDEFHKAATAAFTQRPQPRTIKVGYAAAAAAEPTGAEITAALDAIENVDDGFYWIDVESAMRDTDGLDAIFTWAGARRKLPVITSNDILHEDPSDETNISARHKGTVERGAVAYSDDPTDYPGFAAAAKLGTFDFDQSGSAYTAKFKQLLGVTPLNKGSNAVQAITGYVPGFGQDTATGHCANCYTTTGDASFLREGSTLSPNLFIDDIHFGDWLVSRMEEEMLGILLNAKRVPMDNRGMQVLAQGAERILARAFTAGAVAEDTDEDGELAPAYTVTVPDVFSISEAQRNARVAPPIEVGFRSAGAVHHVNINIQQSA